MANVIIEDTGKRNFGHALRYLKEGKKVARKGWNGKGMWLLLMVPVGTMPIDGAEYKLSPFIWMKTADSHFVPWLASQTDMLAEDWEVVE